ncbi:hypothetical protein OS493_001290 [Desmophyllum pertusum]|uniref:Uncharacterized protein n=1 Tax=Desmophyllum pertusum TaxID=174260 RepID=A0A9W9ZVX4_9CNID|nr:hypothetical protein OS493_001290 [Desmophyllum pertusum]
MSFNQFTTLEEFENYIWHNEIPSSQISEAVDRLMALSFPSQSILTVDEVEQVQRKRLASIIGHIFQLTYATLCDPLIHEEKVHRCNGCAIDHPSQRQHSCIMMDTEDAWNYYHDEAREKIDLGIVMKTVESVCSAVGLKLGKSWEAYLTELPTFPWTVASSISRLWNLKIVVKISRVASYMPFTTAPMV